MMPTHTSSRKVIGGGVNPPPKASAGSGAGGGKASKEGLNFIPARQFNTLQKQATSIDEARNSLAGDDPSQVGGLAADLGVFDSPDSVQRISEYLNFINNTLEEQSRSAAATGPLAATEWYFGLPQTISNLEAAAARQYGATLQPDEQQFVSDYYRVLGTIGGLRASTGASSARWSFSALQKELPTPGPVTDRSDAERRIRNLLQETNVVAKRNPMATKTDVEKVGGKGGKGGKPGTKSFKVGTDVYDIPVDKVEAFKKKYPRAVAQ